MSQQNKTFGETLAEEFGLRRIADKPSKVAPKMIKPPAFDPDRDVPVHSNPDFIEDEPEPPIKLSPVERERFRAPSKRRQPEMKFGKGGKVISTRRW